MFRCLMVHSIFAAVMISILSTNSSAGEGNLSVIHQEWLGCMDRFHQVVEQNLSHIQSDVNLSEKRKETAEAALNKKWKMLSWVDSLIDDVIQDQWDWENPERLKTESGKIRGLTKRIKLKLQEMHQLQDILSLDAVLYPRVNLLFSKSNQNKKVDMNEWKSIRSLMQKREQAYYDFIGDQTRQQVYERGFVNVVVWNKTMGQLQENFFRNVSCVTIVDQVRFMIPKKMLDQSSYQLVEDQRQDISPEI